MDIAIIGAGIAGELTAYDLLLRGGCKVTLYDPHFSPGTASFCSTGVVGTFGTTCGHSPLGDLLSRAFIVAKGFYEKFNHSSIEPCPLYYLAPPPPSCDYDSFTRRFSHLEPLALEEGRGEGFQEEGMLIDAPSFMNELRRRNDRSPHCFRVISTITSWEQVDHHSLIFYAPGALRFLHSLDGLSSKIRRGTFLQWQIDDNQKSFHYDYYRTGTVSYRRRHKKLLVSSINGTEMHASRDRKRAWELYEKLNQVFPLPPFSRAEICSGVRELAGDRMPQLQRVGEKHYSLTGLYRSGYTLAPFFAEKFSNCRT